jgi:CubicO group peptidase (beta-lactamase class C family)
MLETCSKHAWESLMNTFIFQPLGMTSTDFSDPGTDQLIDQPLGHARWNGKLTPVDPESRENSPPAVGPGATAHCSIADFLKFAVSHAGKNSLVSDGTLQRLHRRYGASEYSCGWFVVERYWGHGYVISHSGNTWGWSATMWIAPLRNVAFVAASNYNEQAAVNACNQAIEQMIARLL